jgi:hypothetical protein
MRWGFANGTRRTSVTADAVVCKRAVVRLGIGHPRGRGVAVCAIFTNERHVVGRTWHSIGHASVVAAGAGLAYNLWITVVKMGWLEGRRGVAISTIIRGRGM